MIKSWLTAKKHLAILSLGRPAAIVSFQTFYREHHARLFARPLT
jgi:hypothetical protein